MVQNCKNIYLVDIDLDEMHKKYSDLSDFLKDICLLSGAIFLEWSQYVDHGIGSIHFYGEEIKVIWEEFPNNLSFEINSFKNASLFIEKINNAIN